MYGRMYKLNEIIEFFHEELGIIDSDERIEEMYDLISNPHLRVNDDDKQWVAFSSEDSENKTVEDAMKEILDYGDFTWEINKDNVVDKISKVGNIFIENNIKMKPRIPFYIMVLDEIKI